MELLIGRLQHKNAGVKVAAFTVVRLAFAGRTVCCDQADVHQLVAVVRFLPVDDIVQCRIQTFEPHPAVEAVDLIEELVVADNR